MSAVTVTHEIGFPCGLAEAAFYLGMHASYLRKYAKEGLVASGKDEKGRWSFTQEQLDALKGLRDNKVAMAMAKKDAGQSGHQYRYVPKAVKDLQAVMARVGKSGLDEAEKAACLTPLQTLLEGAMAEWAAKEAAATANEEGPAEL